MPKRTYQPHKPFYEEMQTIKDDINEDINECNAKEAKDIIILIDLNIYTKTENNNINLDRVDAFICQANNILNNYLSSYDRFSLFIYKKEYKIICPLIYKHLIDIQSISKDLNNYRTIILDEQAKKEYDINFEDFHSNDKEFELGGNDFFNNSQEESSENNDKIKSLYNEMEGLIETINYIKNYFKMKEGVKNEKYIILFTDLFNADLNRDDRVDKLFDKLKENKEVIFILAGKNKNLKRESDEISGINYDNKYFIKLLLNKFGEKSEIIYFDNMTKINSILSCNKVIKDDIIYPNEIYK